MSDTATVGIDRPEEEILTHEVSDEALETAVGHRVQTSWEHYTRRAPISIVAQFEQPIFRVRDRFVIDAWQLADQPTAPAPVHYWHKAAVPTHSTDVRYWE